MRKQLTLNPIQKAIDRQRDDGNDQNNQDESAKGKEKDRVSLMQSIPTQLPPLRRAIAIQRKAANIGFDWPDCEGVIGKLHEEIGELETGRTTIDR